MSKIKVMSIIGTRPEAIKMVSVIRELRRVSAQVASVVVNTAQHREMVDTVFRLFRIKPEFDCNLMQSQQTLTQITTRALIKLNQIITSVRPDIVLVQGDTTTAFAGALAAFYQKIHIGHIEAGLRSFDKYNPYPEEINRRLITTLADWHFAPTNQAKQYLLQENIPASKIYITGNTGVDAVLTFTKRKKTPGIPELNRVDWTRKIILAEVHRRENWGQPLQEICSALCRIIDRNPNLELIFPHHLNPTVSKTVYRMLSGNSRIHLFAATNYADFIWLMNRATIILTDSGGIQEEAPVLGKPVLLLRNVTERPEAVHAGVVKVIGTKAQKILAETQRLLDDKTAYQKMARRVPLYGDGKAAHRIVNIIRYQFGLQKSLPEEFCEPV